MIRTVLFLGLVASLSACSGGQPFFEDPDDGNGEPPAQSLVPAEIAANLRSASFTPPRGSNDGQLVVRIESLDSTPGRVAYDRNPDLDVPGFVAYSVQEDPLDRFFTGMARRSTDGSMQGAVVADGGQFNRHFGGVFYERLTPYTAYVPSQPGRGLVSYAGDYVGLLNGAAPEPNETLPVPPGTDPTLIPQQSSRVTGDIFLNADFTDNTVNGAITRRRVVDLGIGLEDVIFVPTDIPRNGQFEGIAENPDQDSVGTYSGAFGGQSASAVAGGTFLQDFIDDVENEEEHGLFVLTRCGLQGDAPICDDVDPRRSQ